MTRRDLIHKWLVYALGLLPLWLLDDYILPRYPLFGVTPMLLPVAAAAVAVLEGAYAGAGFGMAVGLLWELAYPGGFGGLVLGMALAGMAIGALAQYALSQSFPGCLLCSAAILALLDLLRVLRQSPLRPQNPPPRQRQSPLRPPSLRHLQNRRLRLRLRLPRTTRVLPPSALTMSALTT